MDKSDHISVTLSGVGVSGTEEDSFTAKQPHRRSLRRVCTPIHMLNALTQILQLKKEFIVLFLALQSWNQLPRCQRNLIILAVLALCLTLVLVLYNDQIDAENSRLIGNSGAFLLRENRDAANSAGLTQNGLGEGINAMDAGNLNKNLDNPFPDIGPPPLSFSNDNAPLFKDVSISTSKQS